MSEGTRVPWCSTAVSILLVFAPAVVAQPPMSIRSDGLEFPDGSVQTTAPITVGTDVNELPGSATTTHRIEQPGLYYLSANILGAVGLDGIEIAASDVTLDLNGFTLEGVPGSGDGITLDGTQHRITVRNGFVTQWDGHGVRLQLANDVVVERIVAYKNTNFGILAQRGRVVDCHASENLVGIDLEEGYLARSTATANTSSGFQIGGGAPGVATELVARLNKGSGLSQSSSGVWTIANSSFFQNEGHGLNVCSRTLIHHNNISNNGTGSGVTDGAGIHLRCGTNVVHDNVVTHNDVGIAGGSVGDDVVTRNILVANGTDFEAGTSNDFGPTGDAATASSPWANIVH